MKKRGDITISTLIGAVFVAILIFFVVMLIYGDFLFGSPEYQASEKSYKNLLKEAQALEYSKDNLAAATLAPFALDTDVTVVCFNKNESFSYDACPPNERVPKPALCGKDACLCLYAPGKYANFNIDNRLSKQPCIPFPDVDYFISFYYAGFDAKGSAYAESHYSVDSTVYKNIVGDRISLNLPPYYPSEEYSYLFLYGQCDGWAWDQDFGNHEIYLEKFKDPKSNKTYLFIAKNVRKDIITARAGSIQKGIDGEIKQTPDKFLDLINSSLEKNNTFDARNYADLYKKYYGEDPAYKDTTLAVYLYVELINQKQKQIDEENKKLLAEQNSPPAFPPGFG
jgi:hypothetical protein